MLLSKGTILRTGEEKKSLKISLTAKALSVALPPCSGKEFKICAVPEGSSVIVFV
jgi:hypothetical protein